MDLYERQYYTSLRLRLTYASERTRSIENLSNHLHSSNTLIKENWNKREICEILVGPYQQTSISINNEAQNNNVTRVYHKYIRKLTSLNNNNKLLEKMTSRYIKEERRKPIINNQST